MVQNDLILGGITGLAITGAAAWALNWVGTEAQEVINEWRFYKTFRAAILHSQPSWKEVCSIAEVKGVPKETAFRLARQLHTSVLAGKDKGGDLQPYRALLEQYMADFREEEPFEGFKPRARLALERIKKDLGGSTEALNSVMEHLSELMTFQEGVNKRQRYYTFFGFVVGVISFGYAIYVTP